MLDWKYGLKVVGAAWLLLLIVAGFITALEHTGVVGGSLVIAGFVSAVIFFLAALR